MSTVNRRTFLTSSLVGLGAAGLVATGVSQSWSSKQSAVELPHGFSYAPGNPPPKPNAFFWGVVDAVTDRALYVKVGADTIAVPVEEPAIWKMGMVWPASVKARIQPGDRVVLIGDADDNGFRCRMCWVNVPALDAWF
ncbi:MAG: hypothetical protein RMJ55_13425 [Roseiflexaceae bacterium]|nr:hypothetical protein [Roseiflexus sp.]MCS7289011.1 hypothetical protein [Roseiflexus sp.]MDW8148433.1 hypothetical protein [Roseiflexaceae bacterium]MDW8214554.1 hypothetical protein [Roseiflexaceae bacterium]